MFYSWSYLRRLGINVFHFAPISDFLLGSLKEPLGWYASARYRSMNYLAVVVVVLVLLDVLAAVKARDTLAGKGQRVEVVLADGGTATSVDLIGSTGQFLFVFDAAAGRGAIYPHQGVLGINVRVPDADGIGLSPSKAP